MCLTEFDVESAIKTWREDGYEDGYTEGRTDGIAEGITQGRTAGKLEAARNLIAEGDSPEKVARCTGLPLGEVRKLAEQMCVTKV